MKFRPFSHPLNWYPYDVTGSLELLQAYVDDPGDALVTPNIP